ncbi:MAG: DUF4239 domain-containing protein [Acetobacteraceae bacterium]|nr:DUF4239 domain-containing protein [Acetobacteraceae bacterium]
MSELLFSFLIVAGAILFAIGGVWFGRRALKGHVADGHLAEGHNDVLVALFLTAGVIYAVLLGLLVIAQRTSFDMAVSTTADEASLLVPLYRQSHIMSADHGGQMRVLLREYAIHVVRDWGKFQKTGKTSLDAGKIADAVIKLYANLTPTTKAQELVDAQFLATFSDLLLARHKRMLEASQNLPWLMWVAAIGGGIVVVGMSFFLYMERPVPHMVMTSVLASLTAMMLVIMMLLDHPFQGPLAISVEPFKVSLRMFDSIDENFK